MADTNPIILSFQTEGLEKSNAELKATATNINAIGTATNDVTKDIVDLTNAVKTSKEQLATMKPNTKEFKELSDEIKAAEVSIKGLVNTQESLRAEFANVKKDIGQVNAIMKEMEKQGLTNTKTYQGLAAQMDVLKKKGGELKDSIGDMNQEFKTIGSDTRGIDTVIQGVQGIAAGFQIAQGASALFGTENKKLEETLIKLNATMAIAQGLQQVQQLLQRETALATAAMSAAQTAYNFVLSGSTALVNAFRVALAATGIGAFIALIYGAYEAFKAFQEGTAGATEATLQLNDAIEKELEQQKQVIKGLATEKEYLTAIGKTKAEIAKITLNEQIKLNTILLEQQANLNKKLGEQAGSTINGFLNAFKAFTGIGVDITKKTRDNLAANNKEIENASKETIILEKELNDELDSEREEAAKKERERIAKIAAQRKKDLEDAEKTYDAITKKQSDVARNVRLEREKEREQKEKDDEKELERLARIAREEEEFGKEKDKKEDEKTQKQIDREKNIATAKMVAMTAVKELSEFYFQQEQEATQQELNDRISALDQAREAELANKNLTEEQKAQIDAKYKALEYAARIKAFNDDKRTKIQQAIINGALAVTNAIATAPTILAGLALAAGVAITTSLQIATIQRTQPPKFKDGGSVAKRLGYIEGKPHSAGGELIEVEGNEFVM